MQDIYGVVYLITCQIDHKMYVGQTTQGMEKRWKGHVKDARRYTTYLYNAINLHGNSNFKITVLCYCSSKVELDIMEKFYVDFIGTWRPYGYNLRAGGSGRGACSDEEKEKMSKRFSGAGNPHYGKPRPPDVIEKISVSNMGEKNGMFGKHQSLETIEKRIRSLEKEYQFLSPRGEKVIFKNLKKFCRENDLTLRAMYRVIDGSYKHHKGWTKGKRL